MFTKALNIRNCRSHVALTALILSLIGASAPATALEFTASPDPVFAGEIVTLAGTIETPGYYRIWESGLLVATRLLGPGYWELDLRVPDARLLSVRYVITYEPDYPAFTNSEVVAITNTVQVISCGNGRFEVGEQCDDGGRIDGDGCSRTCTIEECGNGILDLGEECDDGNLESGDGCSAECLIVPVGCGDGSIGGGEECDDGNEENGDGCSRMCIIEFCGDAEHHPGIGEQCDDGNTENGDGCNDECRFELSSESVFPNGYESQEGNGSGALPFRGSWNGTDCGARSQQIFDGSQIGIGAISELRYRRNLKWGSSTAPTFGPVVLEGVKIMMSTTNVGTTSLSRTFADNHGSYVRTVFEGDLELSSSSTALPTREFDIVVPLQSPFWFDGSQSNLLVDFTVTHSACSGTSTIDAERELTSTMVVYGEPDDLIAPTLPVPGGGGAITKFILEPTDCTDGVDNDEDETVDYPEDEGCKSPGDQSESCGLLGVEALMVLGGLGLARRLRSRIDP